MNCARALLLLEEQLDGPLECLAETALAEHLRVCGACAAERAAMLALQQRLAVMPLPPPAAGFADRVLARAHAANPLAAPALRVRPWWIGGALAASLLLMSGLWTSRETLPEVLAIANEPVRLVFRSADALQGVTIELELPEGVELRGYPGQRQLVWQSDIQAGPNLLELPVEVRGGGGVLTATLNHGVERRQFSVRVVAAAAVTVEDTDV
jgi:hypothetical protein